MADTQKEGKGTCRRRYIALINAATAACRGPDNDASNILPM
jgi:hypothetical protein